MTTQQTLLFSCPFFWHKLRRVAGPKIIPSKVPNGATILSHITYLSTNVPHRGTDPLRWIRQPFCQHLLQVNAHCDLTKKSHTTKICLKNSPLHLSFVQLSDTMIKTYSASQCGGLSLRCHRATVYRESKIRRTSAKNYICWLE